jgi:hypothetical protein
MLAIAIIVRLPNHSNNYGTGDGGMIFVLIMLVQSCQIVAGSILSIIYSIVELRLKTFKILAYFFLNSLLTLFFIYGNIEAEGEYYELVFAIGGVLILVSFIYAFLIKKHSNL